MMGVFMAPVSAIPTGEIATDFPLLIWDLLRIKQPRMYRCVKGQDFEIKLLLVSPC
ncbi:predicted protein [Botrytis cinerea T4]|uniref:Uncharacterized protein n=1 Tax=Botryotinia fuckeliana (strain T4) TaxID=999810 RepID=G2XV99_BOTF4|nr:predicted protein [Botrytis cinerea T4]